MRDLIKLEGLEVEWGLTNKNDLYVKDFKAPEANEPLAISAYLNDVISPLALYTLCATMDTAGLTSRYLVLHSMPSKPKHIKRFTDIINLCGFEYTLMCSTIKGVDPESINNCSVREVS